MPLPMTAWTGRERVTSRAGSPRASSHSGAATPITSDAVLAMFASTHDAAATLTVRQCSTAGSPVAAGDLLVEIE